MKKIVFILGTTLLTTGCYKDDQSKHSGNAGSHHCGYITQQGTACQRLVSGSSGYCWQHR